MRFLIKAFAYRQTARGHISVKAVELKNTNLLITQRKKLVRHRILIQKVVVIDIKI